MSTRTSTYSNVSPNRTECIEDGCHEPPHNTARCRLHYRQYNTRWQAKNRERCRVTKSRWLASQMGVVNTLTYEEWLTILDAHDRKCVYCQNPYEVIEHMTPMSKGGPNAKNNVAPACVHCNRVKKDEVWVPTFGPFATGEWDLYGSGIPTPNNRMSRCTN